MVISEQFFRWLMAAPVVVLGFAIIIMFVLTFPVSGSERQNSHGQGDVPGKRTAA